MTPMHLNWHDVVVDFPDSQHRILQLVLHTHIAEAARTTEIANHSSRVVEQINLPDIVGLDIQVSHTVIQAMEQPGTNVSHHTQHKAL